MVEWSFLVSQRSERHVREFLGVSFRAPSGIFQDEPCHGKDFMRPFIENKKVIYLEFRISQSVKCVVVASFFCGGVENNLLQS